MKFKIEQKTTAREILAAIDEWAISNCEGEPQHLWNILSALRGPDNESFEDKRTKTAPIRSVVLPNLADKASARVDYVNQNTYKTLGELSKLHDTQFHFNNHIRYAAQSILATERDNSGRE